MVTDKKRIGRFTGDVMRGTGSDFELSATIGRPDAGVREGGKFPLRRYVPTLRS